MSYLLYPLFVTPAAKWILSNQRWQPRLRMLLAVLFLLAVSSYDIVPDAAESYNSNFFVVLGVPVDASQSDIKRAYRQMSLKYHPDKYDGDDAEEAFRAITTAYEVLSQPLSRDVYEKFGLDGLQALQKSSSDDIFMTMLLRVALPYCGRLLLVLIMSIMHSKGAPLCRKWSFIGMGILFALEVGCKFADYNFLVSVMPYVPRFLKLDTLTAFFPGYVIGASIIAGVMYVDPIQLLHSKVDTLQREIRQVQLDTRDLMATIAEARVAGGSGGPTTTTTANKPVSGSMVRKRAVAGPQADAAAAAAGRPVGPEAQAQAQAFSANAEQKTRIPGFVKFLGFMLVMKYVFGFES